MATNKQEQTEGSNGKMNVINGHVGLAGEVTEQ